MADEHRVTGRTRKSACGWYVMRRTPSTDTARSDCGRHMGSRSADTPTEHMAAQTGKLGRRAPLTVMARETHQELCKLSIDFDIAHVESIRRLLFLKRGNGKVPPNVRLEVAAAHAAANLLLPRQRSQLMSAHKLLQAANRRSGAHSGLGTHSVQQAIEQLLKLCWRHVARQVELWANNLRREIRWRSSAQGRPQGISFQRTAASGENTRATLRRARMAIRMMLLLATGQPLGPAARAGRHDTHLAVRALQLSDDVHCRCFAFPGSIRIGCWSRRLPLLLVLGGRHFSSQKGLPWRELASHCCTSSC